MTAVLVRETTMSLIHSAAIRIAAGEFRKLWSVSLYRWLMLSPLVVGVVAGAGGAVSGQLESAAAAGRLETMLAVLAATTLATGSEYRFRTITHSILSTGRDRLFGAKFAVGALVGLLAGIGCLASTTLGAWFGQASSGDIGNVAWTGLLAVFATVCWAIAGTGIGLAAQRADVVLVGVLAWLLLFEPMLVALMALFGTAFVAGPALTSVSLAGVPHMGEAELLGSGTAALTLAIWVLVVAGGGWWLARERPLGGGR